MATVNVRRASENEEKPSQKAAKTYYADAEGNVVTDSANAAFHLTNEGEEILPHIAKRYGFVDGKPKTAAKSTAPTENKAVETKSDIKVADNRPGVNKTEVKK
jgi:hypothetical protein